MSSVEAPELSALVLDILAKRGITDPEQIRAFINPSYDQHLHDPFLIKDMDKAVKRILKAVENQQKIVIYGDYDIDGITATSVLVETIKNLGHQAEYYIPDRFEEGYGINLEALKQLKKDGAELIISVDCGVTAVDEVAWANKNGLDIIITDHHAVPPVVPETIVLNPKQQDDQYPFKELAGVGVAFKLAQALQSAVSTPGVQATPGVWPKGQEKWLLDLVALGTVCDAVPLIGENRVLAKYGLTVMRKTRRPGLLALAAVGGVAPDKLASYHLGFILGPRLNAAGRLEHASKSLQLMLTNDSVQALEAASQLNALNRQRQADQAVILAEALEQAAKYADDPVLVLASPNWSHGIVGIVASKIVERTGKPTLVAQTMGATTKGSARSVGGFNMVEALRSASQHLTKFGGHYFAAGFTLDSSKLDALRAAVNKHYRQVMTQQLEKELDVMAADGHLDNLGGIDWPLWTQLEQLEPYGHGNPTPIFSAKNLKVVSVGKVGLAKNHLKLTLADRGGKTLEAIGFNLADIHPNLAAGQEVDACFQVSKNEFNDRINLQLVLTDLR